MDTFWTDALEDPDFGFESYGGITRFSTNGDDSSTLVAEDFEAGLRDFSLLETWVKNTGSEIMTGNVAGDAWAERQWWNFQGFENSCAVVAQQGVLESIFERDLSKRDLVRLAEERGWYDPAEGTMPEYAANILSEFGIPVEKGVYQFSDIYTAVASGERVIVALNANEVWNPMEQPDGRPIQQDAAGHAVWVTGIVERDGLIHVVMNDSGHKRGWQREVELKHFLNAWDDHQNFAIITQMSV